MPDIIVNDIDPRIQYVAAGGQTVFAYPFPIFALTDLQVWQTPNGTVANDATNLLTYTTNYIVTNNVPPAVGGTITLNVAANAGDIITIIRNMPEARLNNYIDGGLFSATQVNTDFDRTVFMAQTNTMFERDTSPAYDTSAIINNNPGATSRVDLTLPILPALNVWQMNASRTGIVAAPLTTPVGNSSFQLTLPINQAGHGLVAGNVVRLNGALFVTALADNAADAEVVGVVINVIDANNFTLQIAGLINMGLVGLTAGSVFFLSPTVAGGLTAIRPVMPTQVVKPYLIANSATSGFIINELGTVI